MIADEVQRYIDAHELPSEETFYSLFCGKDGHFIDQEGVNWDFKDRWPFSYSDEYFAGIARLICAFANTNGGFIIFGVHDQKRTGGHNKVTVNMDRLLQALTQLCNTTPKLTITSYASDKEVYCLLVLPRSGAQRPIVFTKAIGRYPANSIWVRQGHEVILAQPKHVPLLFFRRTELSDSDPTPVGGQLPPNPLTLKQFVGRLETLSDIFHWLFTSDDKRLFLYGKGGSGKTAIAFEVARYLKRYGSTLEQFSGEQDIKGLDNIIFMSAKDRALDTKKQEIIAVPDPDFYDELSLYKKILYLGGWVNDAEALQHMGLVEAKAELQQLLDITNNVIIIDDIDTLTSRQVEAGFDFLLGALYRCRGSTKILYTLRNLPVHSMANSIEVHGLNTDGEYQSFVELCCEQFEVPGPTADFRDRLLAAKSERRPLVVEAIIALRRTTPSYEKALELFDEHTGDDIRQYVFRREWLNLSNAHQSRLLLVALSLLDAPVSFDDLSTILTMDSSRLKDCVGDTREMFLEVNDAGNTSTYSLAPLTREFVRRESTTLDRYSVIKKRVENFQANFIPQNPIVTRLRLKVEDLLARYARTRNQSFLLEAWSMVEDRNLLVSVVESPRFKATYGLVACQLIPPRLDDARKAFAYCWGMRFAPNYSDLRTWFAAEQSSGVGYEYCTNIYNYVTTQSKYTRMEILELKARYASATYYRGRDKLYDEPTGAMHDLLHALHMQLELFRANVDHDNEYVYLSEKRARDTCFTIFNAARGMLFSHSTGVLSEILTATRVYFDPIEEPIREYAAKIVVPRVDKAELGRGRGKLQECMRLVQREGNWLSPGARGRVVDALSELLKHVERTKH